jgi:hypothetical protein
LSAALREYRNTVDDLPGVADEPNLNSFVAQLIESQRRNRYIERLLDMPLSPASLTGPGGSFDPLKGAILKQRAGDHDEGCWLVFLSVHFGKNRRTGWQLAGDFYGRLGQRGTWDWMSTSGDVLQMRGWLDANYEALRSAGGRFGNHRKYESLKAWSDSGTGHVIATYVDWVGGEQHAERFANMAAGSTTPRERFAALYKSLGSVGRFGRTARFDYLSTLGKLALADVEADCAHLGGATGPLTGARLLLDGDPTSNSRSAQLERRLAGVRCALGVTFDVLEDALCNWQKSPSVFVPFRG